MSQKGLNAYSIGAKPAGVKEVAIPVNLTPLGAALSATSTLYVALPSPPDCDELDFVITELSFSLDLAGNASASNKWSLSIDSHDGDGTYSAVLASTDIAAAVAAFFIGEVTSGFSQYDVANGDTAPYLRITLTKGGAAPNIDAGVLVIRGYFEHALGS